MTLQARSALRERYCQRARAREEGAPKAQTRAAAESTARGDFPSARFVARRTVYVPDCEPVAQSPTRVERRARAGRRRATAQKGLRTRCACEITLRAAGQTQKSDDETAHALHFGGARHALRAPGARNGGGGCTTRPHVTAGRRCSRSPRALLNPLSACVYVL